VQQGRCKEIRYLGSRTVCMVRSGRARLGAASPGTAGRGEAGKEEGRLGNRPAFLPQRPFDHILVE
jgi:hypothetical protein